MLQLRLDSRVYQRYSILYHYNVQQYTKLDHVCKQVLHLLLTELVHQISTVVGISLSAYVQQGWISNGFNTNSILLLATNNFLDNVFYDYS